MATTTLSCGIVLLCLASPTLGYEECSRSGGYVYYCDGGWHCCGTRTCCHYSSGSGSSGSSGSLSSVADSSSGLSGGAIAGIVIGSIVGFVILSCLVCACEEKLCKKKTHPEPAPHTQLTVATIEGDQEGRLYGRIY